MRPSPALTALLLAASTSIVDGRKHMRLVRRQADAGATIVKVDTPAGNAPVANSAAVVTPADPYGAPAAAAAVAPGTGGSGSVVQPVVDPGTGGSGSVIPPGTGGSGSIVANTTFYAEGTMLPEEGCGGYHVAVEADTIFTILDGPCHWDLPSFLAVNPSLSHPRSKRGRHHNCGIEVGKSYCIAPPANLWSGARLPSHGCRKYHTVVAADTCAALAETNGISLKDLKRWNAPLDCKLLLIDHAYCIGDDSEETGAPPIPTVLTTVTIAAQDTEPTPTLTVTETAAIAATPAAVAGTGGSGSEPVVSPAAVSDPGTGGSGSEPVVVTSPTPVDDGSSAEACDDESGDDEVDDSADDIESCDDDEEDQEETSDDTSVDDDSEDCSGDDGEDAGVDAEQSNDDEASDVEAVDCSGGDDDETDDASADAEDASDDTEDDSSADAEADDSEESY